jgi:hypothetical protein
MVRRIESASGADESTGLAEYQSTDLPHASFQLHTSLAWGQDLSRSLQGEGGSSMLDNK